MVHCVCIVFRRPFVKRFTLCYWTVVLSVCPVCSVCPSVTLVYCGQTVAWIKMSLGMEVGISLGHIVLDGDQARPSPGKGGRKPPPHCYAETFL